MSTVIEVNFNRIDHFILQKRLCFFIGFHRHQISEMAIFCFELMGGI